MRFTASVISICNYFFYKKIVLFPIKHTFDDSIKFYFKHHQVYLYIKVVQIEKKIPENREHFYLWKYFSI